MTTKKYELPVLLDLCGGSMVAMRGVLPLYVLNADGLCLDREAIAGALALDGDRDFIYGPSQDSELIDALFARAEIAGLTWTPSNDISKPALPVPFAAHELAAFMLAGGGLSLFERFDDALIYSGPAAPKPTPPGDFRIPQRAVSNRRERRGPNRGPVVLGSHADEAREAMHEAMLLRHMADDNFGRDDEGVRKSADWLLNDAYRQLSVEVIPTDKSSPASSDHGWWDIAGPYIAAAQRDGNFATAKDLYNALEARVDSPESPFERGTDQHRGKLRVRSNGQTVALKTLQNKWADVRRSAASR